MPEFLNTSPNLFAIPLDADFAEQRESITHIYETARRLAQWGRPADEINETVGQLEAVPGLTILSEPDFVKDYEFRCAEWTFGHIYGEPWAQNGSVAESLPYFWTRPLEHLNLYNYELIRYPRSGCVVAYGHLMRNKEVWLEHFGIYEGEVDGSPLVVSKFGQAPLVRHPQDVISSNWGGYCFYFEKEHTQFPRVPIQRIGSLPISRTVDLGVPSEAGKLKV